MFNCAVLEDKSFLRVNAIIHVNDSVYTFGTREISFQLTTVYLNERRISPVLT